MDIVIKTGFQRITHNIVFQPKTDDKGKALCKAGHVREVSEHKFNGQGYSFIKCRVTRQTSVNEKAYETSLSVSVYFQALDFEMLN